MTVRTAGTSRWDMPKTAEMPGGLAALALQRPCSCHCWSFAATAAIAAATAGRI